MEFTKDIKFNVSPTAHKNLTITYNGFLADSSELWMVSGFGEDWSSTTEIKMERTNNGFTANINLINSDTFNFCFKNSTNEWDNNNTYNYITPILPFNTENLESFFDELFTPIEPIQPVQNFDIDALIEEILQPIVEKKTVPEVDTTPVQISTQPIDLGEEITRVLSQIDLENTTAEFVEYTNLEDILSGSIIDETPIELFEEDKPVTEKYSVDDIINELIQNTIANSELIETKTPDISTVQTFETTETVETVETNEQKFDFENYEKLNSEITNIVENIEVNEEQIENEETALTEIPDPFTISPRKLSKFYLFRKRVKLAFYKALVKIPKLIFGFEKD